MVIITLYHHLGYSPQREEVKQILENNNIEEATIKLQELITEHDLLKENVTDDEIINFDNQVLHHAALHLEHASLEENQKDRTIRALKEIL